MNPVLKRITIYPLKSMNGFSANCGEILAGGALKFDRYLTISDNQGRFYTAINYPGIHQIHATYGHTWNLCTLTHQISGESIQLDLLTDHQTLTSWLQQYEPKLVTARSNDQGGFPDDLQYPGVTLISTATIETVASWFEDLEPDDIRRRLRTNVEVAGVPPFWEDRLYSDPDTRIQIGNVLLQGLNPCARCAVPGRDPDTGQVTQGFSQTIARNRQATLPEWADPDRFDHYYRLAVNTKLAPENSGKNISVGDVISVWNN